MATVTVQPKGDIWYTVISYKDADGKGKSGKELLKRDRTKNSSSYRTFPMSEDIREMFL